MRYKGTDKPLPEIARELNVDGLVEGSVLRAGNLVRITARLIHAATDQHLWAKSYERDLCDVLAVHRDVAQAVAREIRIRLSPQEAARLGTRKLVNPEAYDAYLRGRYYWNKRTVEDFRKSIEFFKRAIELDPAYAPAQAGLADAYNLLGSYGAIPMKESHPRARAAAMNALEIDEQLGEAHVSLATIIADYYWDWAETEKEFKRAIQLSPNYAVAHYWYASYLMFMDRPDEALTQARQAEELDPLDPIVPTYVGIVLYRARRYEEAITQLRRVLQISPDFVPAHAYIGLVYIQEHMFAEAVEEFRQALSVIKDDPASLAYTGYALGAAGKLAEARKIRDELQHLSARRYVSAYDMAVANIGAGYNDRALDWLEKGYEERNWYLGGLRVDPLLNPLRPHPRFQDLLRRMNFPT
jgi:tetratricopeptide (TPR) repeat protein